MKKIITAAALVMGFAFAAQSHAAITFSFTNGSIVDSKHDLSFSSGATTKKATFQNTDSDQICIYCHTPHGASYTKGPLWNRGGTAATIGNPYSNADTMDGEVLTSFSTSSAACMTCHDGVTSMDNFINTQLGTYNSAGVVRNFGTGGTASIGAITAGITTISSLMGGAAASAADLRDDHPIGVPYCGGFSATTAGSCVDSDFIPASTGSVAAAKLTRKTAAGVTSTPANGSIAYAATDKWWIDTDGTTTSRSKQDLTLFVRTFAAPIAGDLPSVECATCHDVHNSGNGSFLRVSNARSALCLACHVK